MKETKFATTVATHFLFHQVLFKLIVAIQLFYYYYLFLYVWSKQRLLGLGKKGLFWNVFSQPMQFDHNFWKVQRFQQKSYSEIRLLLYNNLLVFYSNLILSKTISVQSLCTGKGQFLHCLCSLNFTIIGTRVLVKVEMYEIMEDQCLMGN